MQDPTPYIPQDAVRAATKSLLVTGAAGLLLAATQNTLTRQNVGAMGVFTKYGGTIGIFTAVGGTYAFVNAAAANLREKDDSYNKALGGFCAGALLGIRQRSMPSVIGCGVLVAATLAAVGYTGGSILSDASKTDEDIYATKTELRTRFRRPVNELINEIGEGRGIYGPNYEERRKRRIKENYGIDVPEPFFKKE